jgi:hypothetical protein
MLGAFVSFPGVVEDLLARDVPIPEAVQQLGQESVFRVALHSIVQVLMLVGPVDGGMAEAQILELARQVATRFRTSDTEFLNSWAKALEKEIAKGVKQKPTSKIKSTKKTKRTSKKTSPRRKR